MSKLLTEVVGTFFLVLVIGLAVLGQAPLAPLAIGSALMVMVYMGGHVSGAHYNPAVTLAVYLRGKLPAKDVGPYMVAQLTGAVLAALAVRAITGETFAPAPGAGVGVGPALLVEVLFTFALALVVLNAATARKTDGNSFYGLAIGFTVFAGAVAGGGISGGAFNPAVGIGPTIVHAAFGNGTFAHLWLYLVGPFAGALLAVAVFRPQEALAEAPAPDRGVPAGEFGVPLPGEKARPASGRTR
jgi:aquaporin Z